MKFISSQWSSLRYKSPCFVVIIRRYAHHQAVVPTFVKEVTDWLRSEDISIQKRTCEIPESSQSTPRRPLYVFALESFPQQQRQNSTNTPVLLHVIPSPTSMQESLPPDVTRNMTNYGIENNNNDGKQHHTSMIHLHQDVWINPHTLPIVKARLLCRLGKFSSRVYARQTHVRRIPNAMAQAFFIQNHLWGFTKARYSYGLFRKHKHENVVTVNDEDDDELVAVATFSNRRHFIRNGQRFRSHELIRFCSKRDGFVIGGISKLLAHFIKEQDPDDIVTLVDRDWGPATSWHSIGFRTCTILSPLVMVVGPDGKRRHLIGNGILKCQSMDDDDGNHDVTTTNGNTRHDRLGLPNSVLEELSTVDEYEAAIQCLAHHGFYPVYDAGVERLVRIIQKHSTSQSTIDEATWNSYNTTYTSNNHSDNTGISALFRHTRNACVIPNLSHAFRTTEIQCERKNGNSNPMASMQKRFLSYVDIF